MYKITWDNETGGILLNLKVVDNTLSVAPRPIFWEELDLLGLDAQGWKYPHCEEPLMWACNKQYFYRGKYLFDAQGANIYDAPKVVLQKGVEPMKLVPVNMAKMLSCNDANKMLWGTSAEQLVMEGGKVVGAIVKNKDGYIRLNAKKGVVVATGGFGANAEMCNDIYRNLIDVFPEDVRDKADASFMMSGRDGKGHQLCVWAGAAWEPDEPASMVMHPAGQNPFNSPKGAFSTVWLNGEGRRYIAEGGDFQLSSVAGRYGKGKKIPPVFFDPGTEFFLNRVIIQISDGGPTLFRSLFYGSAEPFIEYRPLLAQRVIESSGIARNATLHKTADP